MEASFLQSTSFRLVEPDFFLKKMETVFFFLLVEVVT